MFCYASLWAHGMYINEMKALGNDGNFLELPMFIHVGLAQVVNKSNSSVYQLTPELGSQ